MDPSEDTQRSIWENAEGKVDALRSVSTRDEFIELVHLAAEEIAADMGFPWDRQYRPN